jgi:hypothetical protein
VTLSTIWGGTQITSTRILIAVIAEVAILLYTVWALRLFGR